MLQEACHSPFDSNEDYVLKPGEDGYVLEKLIGLKVHPLTLFLLLLSLPLFLKHDRTCRVSYHCKGFTIPGSMLNRLQAEEVQQGSEVMKEVIGSVQRNGMEVSGTSFVA